MAIFFKVVRRNTDSMSICGDLVSSHDTYVQWTIKHPLKMIKIYTCLYGKLFIIHSEIIACE